MPEMILPGEWIDGGTVIASVYLDDEQPDPTVLLLILMETAPYYYVGEARLSQRRCHRGRSFPNIVPAVEAYKENGGDY